MKWNSYFLEIAKTVSLRSKDPRTKVGAVITNSDGHIVSTGYNGCPPGFPETEYLWTLPDKYDYVVHAEMNAILHAPVYLKGHTLYTTLSPCKDCAKSICASGIKEVYYLEERRDEVTDLLFLNCGISCRKVT